MRRDHATNPCARPHLTTLYREDRTFDPPEQERSTKCMSCGWQGPWEKVTR